MNFIGIKNFVEVYTGEWTVGIVESVDQNEFTITTDYTKTYPRSKVFLFRTHTEKLMGSQKILISSNFLIYNEIIEELYNFIKTDLRCFESYKIFQFVRGKLYYGIHQMLCLDYTTYSNCIDLFKQVLESTLDLIIKIYLDRDIKFTEDKSELNSNDVSAYGRCWPELSHLLEIITNENNSNQFYNVYRNYLEDFEARMRKKYFNVYNSNNITNIIEKIKSLRFLYTMNTVLHCYNISEPSEVIGLLLEKIKLYLNFLTDNDLVYYDPVKIENLLCGLNDNGPKQPNIQNSFLGLHFRAMKYTKSISTKIDIINRISSYGTSINKSIIDHAHTNNFHLIILEHEEIIKKSEFYFQKILESGYNIEKQFLEMVQNSHSDIILNQTISIVIEFIGKIDDNEYKKIFKEFIDKSNLQQADYIVLYAKKFLGCYPDHFSDIIQLIKDIKSIEESVIMMLIVDILSDEKLNDQVQDFIIKSIKRIQPDSTKILELIFSKVDILKFNRIYEIKQELLLRLDSDHKVTIIKCIKYVIDKTNQIFFLKDLEDIYLRVSMDSSALDVYYNLICDGKYYDTENDKIEFCEKLICTLVKTFNKEINLDVFIPLLFELFKQANSNTFMIDRNNKNYNLRHRKNLLLPIYADKHLLNFYLSNDIGDSHDQMYLEFLLGIYFRFDTSNPSTKKIQKELINYIYESADTVNLMKFVEKVFKFYEQDDKKKEFFTLIDDEFVHKFKSHLGKSDHAAFILIYLLQGKKFLYDENFIENNIQDIVINESKTLYTLYTIYYSNSISNHLIIIFIREIIDRKFLNLKVYQLILYLIPKIENFENLLRISNSFVSLLDIIVSQDPKFFDSKIPITNEFKICLNVLNNTKPEVLNIKKIIEFILERIFYNQVIQTILNSYEILKYIYGEIKPGNFAEIILDKIKNNLTEVYFTKTFTNIIKETINTFHKSQINKFCQDIWSRIRKLTEPNTNEENKYITQGLKLIYLAKPEESKNDNIFSELFELLFDLDDELISKLPVIKNSKTRKIGLRILSGPGSSIDNILEKLRSSTSIFQADPQKSNDYLHRIKKSPPGLKNFGSTCYLNVIIQILYNIPDFKSIILSTDIDTGLINSLAYIFAKLEYTMLSSVRSHQLVRNFLDFEGNPINLNLQMDSEEFLTTLISKLEDDGLKEAAKVITSEATRIIECSVCKNTINISENFLTLSLEVKGNSNIYNSIQASVKPEILDQQNQYFCNHCDRKVDSQRYLEYKSLSDYLLISLKRFSYDINQMKMVKVYDRLDFYHKLTIKAGGFDNEFELKGVVLHIGNEDAGHYICLIKNGEQWYFMNDEKVEVIESSKFDINEIPNSINLDKGKESCVPYLLLYKKTIITRKASVITECKNAVNIQKIKKKNRNFLISSMFLAPNFIDFLVSILEHDQKDKTTVALEIYFSTFVYLKCNYTSQYFKVYRGFLKIFENSYEQEMGIYFIKIYFEQVLNILISSIEYHFKILTCNIIKKMINKKTVYKDIDELIEKLKKIFAYDHKIYDFTMIIEIMVILIKDCKRTEFLDLILSYIINQTLEIQRAYNIQVNYIPTKFTSFYKLFLSDEKLLERYSVYFDQTYLPKLLENSSDLDETKVIGKIIGRFVKDYQNFIEVSNIIYTSQNFYKYNLTIDYYNAIENFDSVLQKDAYSYIFDFFNTCMDIKILETMVKVLSRKIINIEQKKYVLGTVNQYIQSKKAQVASFDPSSTKKYLELASICDSILEGKVYEEESPCVPKKGTFYEGALVREMEDNIMLLSEQNCEKIVVVSN